MADVDGGHYFLTTLIPLKREPVRGNDGSASPSHLLRETLATLPTAQQSPACVEAGHSSPFSRCTRTHFARAAVIDQPMYNGRDPGHSIVEGLLERDLLVHQPVDNLSRPYLLFTADFDARPDEDDGGLASWADGLWRKMEHELRAVFAGGIDFEHVRDGATFAAWLRRCQIETTMSFNDYDVPKPDLHGYTLDGLKRGLLVATAGLSLLAWVALAAADLSRWWLLVAVPVALALAIVGVLWLLWQQGRKPFPTGADTDLPSVLKALHVQQRFALLAGALQGADAATVHARFGAFVDEVRPDDSTSPTQPPGVIRSDGVSLVDHSAVGSKRVVP